MGIFTLIIEVCYKYVIIKFNQLCTSYYEFLTLICFSRSDPKPTDNSLTNDFTLIKLFLFSYPRLRMSIQFTQNIQSVGITETKKKHTFFSNLFVIFDRKFSHRNFKQRLKYSKFRADI